MKKLYLILFMNLFLLAGTSFASARWIPNATINQSAELTQSPSVFYNATYLYRLGGNGIGRYNGSLFTDGSGWSKNATINNTLTQAIDEDMRPSVFRIGNNLYMLGGSFSGFVRGKVWSGTGWTNNVTINASMGDQGVDSAPEVFFKDGFLWAVVGNAAGTVNGYVRSGDVWVANTTINRSIGDLGDYSTPSVFNISGTFYMINGGNGGAFNGSVWNGTDWISNSTIISGLPDLGTFSAPEVFFKDGFLYMLTGNVGGVVYGFVYDGLPPQWYTNATNSTTAGTSVLHSVNWTDDRGLSSYKFSFCNGTYNKTTVTNTKAIYNYTDKVNNLAYWASTAGSSPWTTTSEASPAQYNGMNGTNAATATFIADASNDELSIRFNFTINQSASTINWINISFTGWDNATEVGTLHLWNSSSNATNILGTTPASIGAITKNYTSATVNLSQLIEPTNNQLVVYLEGVDYDAPDAFFIDDMQIIVNYNATSYSDSSCADSDAILTNDSVVSFNGVANWSNVTKVINTSTDSTIKWQVWANDTSNNWNNTGVMSYLTTAPAGGSTCWSSGAYGSYIPNGCTCYFSGATPIFDLNNAYCYAT